MLGIRIYKQVALDLWVGPIDLFYCDLLIPYYEVHQNIKSILQDNIRHIGIFFNFSTLNSDVDHNLIIKEVLINVKNFLHTINTSIDLSSLDLNKRISLLFEDKIYYNAAQRLLFNIFPE